MSGASTRPIAGLAVGWATMFAIGTDLFVISPLLPMIAADYRIAAATAGLTVTGFSLSYMICAPLFGHLADRIGRQTVLSWGLAVFAAANFLTAASADLGWLIAARIIAGAAAAAVSPSVYALTAGAAPPERRASWMALVVSGLLVSLAVGAPVGGWAGALFGWRPVFIAIAAACLLLLLPNRYLWRHHSRLAESGAASLGPLDPRIVAGRLLPMVLWATGLYGMYTYLGTGLAAAGYSVEETARAIAMYGIGAIIGVLIGGRLADRLGVKFMAASSLLALALCFLALGAAVHASLLVGSTLALTSAVAQLFFPAQQGGIAGDFPDRRATMMAWNNSALFFGISLGSLLGGQAAALAGFAGTLMVSTVAALLGAIVVGLVIPAASRAGAPRGSA